jgi:hypothetical protein
MTIRKTVAALELQQSESVVVHAASRIFAALIAAGHVNDRSRAEMVGFAVRAALDIALEADRIIASDDEHGGERGRLTSLG